MATATRKAGAAGQPARRARDVRVPEPIRFVIFEDNGRAYRSTLVGGDASSLAQSGSFATYDGAELAARRVRERASACSDRRAEGADRVDLAARPIDRATTWTPSVGWMGAAASAARRGTRWQAQR